MEAKDIFDNYLSLEAIVPIETTDLCLISDIRRMTFYAQKAYILNEYREILIIDARTGRYLNRLRRIGNGPGEYVKIMDMAICDGYMDLGAIIMVTKQFLIFARNLTVGYNGINYNNSCLVRS